MVIGSQNQLVRHGYMLDRDGQAVPKPLRPKSIGDGRILIRQVFARQGWDIETQTRYFRLKSIEAETVEDLTPEQVRTVLGFMEASSMILYRD